MTIENGHRIAHRICPFCEACCGLELTISEGRVSAIRGNPADVFSAGFICPKGAALKDLHEDPDRLRTPLIKRHGVLVEATWDEAFAEVERRLPPLIKQHGRDAVAVVLGNPVAHKLGLGLYVGPLARALGTRNVYSASTLDQMPKQLSAGLMFGSWLSIPVPDIERSDFLLILGANPMVSNGSLWTVPNFRAKAKALLARGGKIVVIDPRRTETAQIATRHHFIRPGADAYFLLGMVHTLFDEKLVRLGSIAPYVAGLAALDAAVAGFSAEAVATRCGIAAETIRELARTLAATPRAAVYGRIGTCTQEFGTLTNWLVDAVNILSGHLDQPGGAMFPKAAAFAANNAGEPGVGRGVITGRRRSRVSGAPEVLGELPITCLPEEIETPGEGQVRALFSIGANPVLSAPDGPRLSAALEQLDFMVSMDIYLNETSRHADVIFPGSSPLEEPHYDIGLSQFGYRNAARFSDVVMEPPAGRPHEWQTAMRLTAIVEGKGAEIDVDQIDEQNTAASVRRRAGTSANGAVEETLQWRGPERLLDLALRSGPYGDQFGANPDGISLAKLKAKPEGIDLGALAPRVPEVLRTPSGKIELAPQMLLDDLKRAAEALAQPAPELVIVGRRQLRSNNSWMHNLPVLAKGPARCTAMVNPSDAQRLGLRDGGRARITAATRSIEVQVQLSDELMAGVVSLPHGWGHNLPGSRLTLAAERPGANLNALFGDRRDPLSGNAVLNGVPIRMQPLE